MFSRSASILPIQCSTIWSVHCSNGIHDGSQGSQNERKTQTQNKSIRIHQYLGNTQTCLQHTQTLVALCQELGWVVNMEKSELEPKQIFDFVDYQYNLREGKVRPTLECWQTLNLKMQELLIETYCRMK